jgi:hypothetical protein
MLLRELATTRTPTTQPAIQYDAERRITLVENADGSGWVPSYDSDRTGNTKKADLETGEDQKGQ